MPPSIQSSKLGSRRYVRICMWAESARTIPGDGMSEMHACMMTQAGRTPAGSSEGGNERVHATIDDATGELLGGFRLSLKELLEGERGHSRLLAWLCIALVNVQSVGSRRNE
jgi:hypothetical protein